MPSRATPLSPNESTGREVPPDAEAAWRAASPADALRALGTSDAGLSAAEAAARLARVGANAVVQAPATTLLRLALRQFASPLVLILVAGAVISIALGDWQDAAVILAIVAASARLGLAQDARASRALARLHSRLALTCTVRRDGRTVQVAAQCLVPGDVIELSAGRLVPADGRLLQARDFLVTEASLTGESLPVEKGPAAVATDAPLTARADCVFSGRSGSGRLAPPRPWSRA